MQFLFRWCGIFFMAMGLAACHQSSQQPQQTSASIIKVEKKPTYKSLYFSGTLAPNKQISVSSPNDGVVLETFFEYGQIIKKGQPLFLIESSKQAADFQTALTGYLKAKEQLNSDAGTLQSTKTLFSKGLVSSDEYKQAQNTYYLSRLSMLQATTQLKDSLKYYQFKKDIFGLDISDFADISQTLATSLKSEQLHINAPDDGVALLASTTSSSSDSSGGDSGGSQSVAVGSQVKQGQVLVTIGLNEGLAMSASANEVDVNQLSVGLPATITSVAFPGVILNGSIVNIASQATTTDSMPTFGIKIVVPTLTPDQLKIIKIGMSAKATVNIEETPEIMVPIDAVFEDPKTSQTMVTKIVNGKSVNTVVQTGTTSENSVVIISGLNPGDEIVSSHSPS